IPLVFRSNLNVPFVRVELALADGGTETAQVLVDTGASYYGAVFVPPFADRIRSRFARTALPPNRPEAGGAHLMLQAARPRGLSAGTLTVREPIVALTASRLRGVDDGLLGSGFLRRFTVALDFEGRTMYLAANDRFGERQLFDASGLGFRCV